MPWHISSGVYLLIKYFKYGKKLCFSYLFAYYGPAGCFSLLRCDELPEIMLAVGFLTNIAYHKKFTNRNILELLVISIGSLCPQTE